jgi:hypothetical protein
MPVGVGWLFLSAILGAESPAVPLCAAETWYRDAREAEATFEGVVERTPGTGRLGPPTRFNAYRLSWTDAAGKAVVREVYAPGKAQLLAAYLGQRVRLVGKAVDTEADGKTYHEIWPARLEPPGGVVARSEGVLARCYWRPTDAPVREPRAYVFRDGREMAARLGLSGDNVEEAATALMARRLHVDGIDWKKQMVVSVTAGLRADAGALRVTRVAVKDGALVVTYRLEPAAVGAAGFGYPAETVLVERCEGAVRLEPAATRPESDPPPKP